MRLVVEDIKRAEQRLDVDVPPSFKAFVTERTLSDYYSWNVLHPTEWWRIQNDENYRGSPGIVFAHGAGGEYYFLTATAADPRVLTPSIWAWDLHDHAAKRLARSVDELPRVIELLADQLLAADG
jgi:hypothetical protein